VTLSAFERSLDFARDDIAMLRVLPNEVSLQSTGPR